MSRRHPPQDLFERVYEAVLARGAGADLDDLGRRFERFRRNVDAISDERERRRWRAIADGLEGALMALRAQAPELAERWMRRGLRRFIMSPEVQRLPSERGCDGPPR